MLRSLIEILVFAFCITAERERSPSAPGRSEIATAGVRRGARTLAADCCLPDRWSCFCFPPALLPVLFWVFTASETRLFIDAVAIPFREVGKAVDTTDPSSARFLRLTTSAKDRKGLR